MKGAESITRKVMAFASFLLLFGLFSGFSYAGTGSSGSSSSFFDVSIDRARLNGQVIAQSSTNLIADSNTFSLLVDFTSVGTLENAHVEATLRGRSTGSTVSDSTSTFNLGQGQKSTAALTLALIDRLQRENEYDLTIRIIDAKGHSEQKTFGLRTKQRAISGKLDVSIDRVIVNGAVVAASSNNFIDKSNDFDVLVEMTALETLENARVEAILRDLSSGNVVSDSTSNFNLAQNARAARLLSLHLIDNMRKSDSFELTIRIVNADGDSIQKTYGLRNKGTAADTQRKLDISINSVDFENKNLAENENNFVVITENRKNFRVGVGLTSLENIENARVDAVLMFENGDVVADTTGIFNINDGQSILKELELPIISRFEINSFRLKVKVTDAEGDFEEKFYGLKISTKKFPFVIGSISLSNSNVDAGKNLGVKLSLENSGVVPLNGLKATVSIPELGASSSKFIDAKKKNMADFTEEFTLKIPGSAQTGSYTVRSEISPQFGSDMEVKELPVFVTGTDDQSQIKAEKLIVNAPVLSQDMRNDGTESAFQLILKNEGSEAKTYTLMLDGSDWASIRLAESNVFIIQPQESKTITIYTASKPGIRGEHIFIATIKSNDKTLRQVAFKGNVADVKSSAWSISLKNILMLILIGSVAMLFGAGILIGLRQYAKEGNGSKRNSSNSDAAAESKPYY